MEQTVEGLCNQLARNRLLDAEAVRGARQRWRAEAKSDADDPTRFGKWLIAGGLVTEFQLGMLTRGFADLLYLGDYKLLDRIGQGRMAGVYKAVHTSSGQVVAIKVLPPSKAKLPQLLTRFLREARLAVRLNHPNVVRTFQLGKTKSDLRYIVMEYLDGETLEDVLQRRKRLPVAEAAHVLTQALRGLEHLDEQSLVHRDLKPANLMLVPAPGASGSVLGSTVKILDIGLGRALFDEGTPSVEEAGDVTNEGTLLGTPSYMAPEQARSAHNADIRADLYSLGCVCYELLTGQTPYPDSSFVRQMVRHATEALKPAKELNPQLPDAVQPLLDKLLAKDPAQRFATPGQAFKAALALAPAPPAPSAAPRSEGPLRKYLTWLESSPPDDEEEPAVPPPAPVRAAPAPAPVPPAAPVAAPPARVRTPMPTVPTTRPTPAPVIPPRPAAVPAAPVATVAAPAAPAWPGTQPLFRVGPVQVCPRDLIGAGVGIGVLLLFEVLIWLLILLFRG